MKARSNPSIERTSSGRLRLLLRLPLIAVRAVPQLTCNHNVIEAA